MVISMARQEVIIIDVPPEFGLFHLMKLVMSYMVMVDSAVMSWLHHAVIVYSWHSTFWR
jgi:hypothetical protein